MKSLVISAILLSFSAGFAQEPESLHFKTSTSCASCFKKVDKAVCEPFKAKLTECRQEAGNLWIKGKNLDVAAIKKALGETGFYDAKAEAKN